MEKPTGVWFLSNSTKLCSIKGGRRQWSWGRGCRRKRRDKWRKWTAMLGLWSGGMCYRIPSIKLVSSRWMSTLMKDISFRVFSKMTLGSSDWQRRQLGAITMARLLTSILVTATLAGWAKTCTNKIQGVLDWAGLRQASSFLVNHYISHSKNQEGLLTKVKTTPNNQDKVGQHLTALIHSPLCWHFF